MSNDHMAFPFSYPTAGGGIGHNQGMTLRDWFAGQALANSSICNRLDEYPQKTAYAFADAMMKERNK